MLTRLKIQNFKRLEYMDIELGEAVVFIGPNNSGKTTALQALALWEIGLKKWFLSNKFVESSQTINRRDLVAIPVPNPRLLWRNLQTLGGYKKTTRGDEKKYTQLKKPITILVEGISDTDLLPIPDSKEWAFALEFYYVNEESLQCRLAHKAIRQIPGLKFASTAKAFEQVKIAFLPPMSGLTAVEPKWEPGRINVLLGEGQTAQVLRNLCYKIYEETPDNWAKLKAEIQQLFAVELLPPEYLIERGEIIMSYRERSGLELDLSSSGRGLQQILLLLAYLYANPGSVLLLDEPDAHLEVLRQRQVYQLLVQVARQQQSQIIAASHSEVVLNEAAERDVVIAFLGSTPKQINLSNQKSQVQKALQHISFDHYYLAEQTGWILYLEGSTDLIILQQLAKKLNFAEAQACLERPFVHYVANQPNDVRFHFEALKYAKPDLVGVALFDNLGETRSGEKRTLPDDLRTEKLIWERKEIENYFCTEPVLLAYARSGLPNDLVGLAEANRREQAMQEAIAEITNALHTLDEDPWSPEIKITDNFLDRVFKKYFQKLGLPNTFRKTSYHELVQFIEPEAIDPEVRQKLEKIVEVAGQARPMS